MSDICLAALVRRFMERMLELTEMEKGETYSEFGDGLPFKDYPFKVPARYTYTIFVTTMVVLDNKC